MTNCEGETFEIVDWGCGQGIATLCLLEALQSRDLMHNLRQVTLVEPSHQTLSRAQANVERMGIASRLITSFEAFLPGTVGKPFGQLSHQAGIVIHLFSNVLDLNGVNLSQLATSIATPQQTHFMLCIGPVNPNSQRIDTFWQAFGEPECFVQMNDPQCSRTSRTMHTFGCKLRGFMHQGAINTPAISINAQAEVMPFDDYDEEQLGRYTPLQLQLQKAFQQIIGPQDTLLINPPLDGPTPDLMVVSPNRGIVIVQSFEENLQDYAIKQNIQHGQNGQENTMLDTNWLVHKQTKEKKPSPFLPLDNCQDHLLDLLADANSYTPQWAQYGVKTVKKVAFFPKNTQKKVDDFFAGIMRNLKRCSLMKRKTRSVEHSPCRSQG